MLQRPECLSSDYHFTRPARMLLLASNLFCVGCNGSDSPAVSEMDGPMVEPVMEVPATASQLKAFSDALNRWGSATDSGTLDDVDYMVGTVEVVLFGTLGPSGAGRKEYLAQGIYSSYANLEVRDVEVIKGTLPEPSQYAYAEVSWPINVAPDELIDTTPVGARVILLADHVQGALESAQKVEADGVIDAVADVKTNLLGVPGYGLLVEGVDGQTHTPMWSDGSPLVVNGADELTDFENAMAAIRAAAER